MTDASAAVRAGTASGRVQQKACGALLELAAAAAGEEGCAVAGRAELTVLLDALRSPVDSVRDAALRVSRIHRARRGLTGNGWGQGNIGVTFFDWDCLVPLYAI